MPPQLWWPHGHLMPEAAQAPDIHTSMYCDLTAKGLRVPPIGMSLPHVSILRWVANPSPRRRRRRIVVIRREGLSRLGLQMLLARATHDYLLRYHKRRQGGRAVQRKGRTLRGGAQHRLERTAEGEQGLTLMCEA